MYARAPSSRPTFSAADRDQMGRFVRHYAPAWLRDQIDDLVQMALVRMWRAGSEVEHRAAYMRKVAYSTVVDEVRRARYQREVGMTTSVRTRLCDSMELSPETEARGGQVGDELQQALGKLNEARRQAVELHLQSYSVPEIAEKLGQGRKQTANQVYRGLADMRKHLTAQGVTP